MTFQELLAAAPPAVAWLWHGFLAPGNVTLLTSRWKAGKTTLVAALLARLGQGGTLAGLAVHPGRAAVVSEESPEQWRRRGGWRRSGSRRAIGRKSVHEGCPLLGCRIRFNSFQLVSFVSPKCDSFHEGCGVMK